jgi:hypothetical protein
MKEEFMQWVDVMFVQGDDGAKDGQKLVGGEPWT